MLAFGTSLGNSAAASAVNDPEIRAANSMQRGDWPRAILRRAILPRPAITWRRIQEKKKHIP